MTAALFVSLLVAASFVIGLWLNVSDSRAASKAAASQRDDAIAEMQRLCGRLLDARRDASSARRQVRRARQHADALLARAAKATLEPLAAARSMTAGLMAAPTGQTDQRQRLNVLEESLSRLARACEDLAQLSRTSATAARLQRVDPVMMIERVADRHREAALARRIELRLPPPDPLLAAWADPERLDRVLCALMDNAVRYNREAGLVMVEFRRWSSGLTIYVHDTGLGVQADRIESLFDPFATPSGGARRGVGLALARRLARSMQGEVRLDSAPGEGSTASLHLKLAPPLPVAAPKGPSRSRLNVVHLDADPVGRGVVRHHCDSLDGVTLHQAETVEAGLTLARSVRADAVLLSLSRDMSEAAELRRLLDADAASRDLPLAVIARLDSLPPRRSAGVAEWLDIPLEGRAFTAALMRLTSLAALRSEPETQLAG